MKYYLLPLKAPPLQRLLFRMTFVAAVVHGIYQVSQDNLKDAAFPVILALFGAGFANWQRNHSDESTLQLDDDQLVFSTSPRSAPQIVRWDQLEELIDQGSSITLYYRDGGEPRLLEIEQSRFHETDWNRVHDFTIKRQPEQVRLK